MSPDPIPLFRRGAVAAALRTQLGAPSAAVPIVAARRTTIALVAVLATFAGVLGCAWLLSSPVALSVPGVLIEGTAASPPTCASALMLVIPAPDTAKLRRGQAVTAELGGRSISAKLLLASGPLDPSTVQAKLQAISTRAFIALPPGPAALAEACSPAKPSATGTATGQPVHAHVNTSSKHLLEDLL